MRRKMPAAEASTKRGRSRPPWDVARPSEEDNEGSRHFTTHIKIGRADKAAPPPETPTKLRPSMCADKNTTVLSFHSTIR